MSKYLLCWTMISEIDISALVLNPFWQFRNSTHSLRRFGSLIRLLNRLLVGSGCCDFHWAHSVP